MMRLLLMSRTHIDESAETAAIDAVFLASMGLEFRIIMESRRSPEEEPRSRHPEITED
jgi:hypothetical protein